MLAGVIILEYYQVVVLASLKCSTKIVTNPIILGAVAAGYPSI